MTGVTVFITLFLIGTTLTQGPCGFSSFVARIKFFG